MWESHISCATSRSFISNSYFSFSFEVSSMCPFICSYSFLLTSFVFSLPETKETVSADGSSYTKVYQKVFTNKLWRKREKSTFPLVTTRSLQYWLYKKHFNFVRLYFFLRWRHYRRVPYNCQRFSSGIPTFTEVFFQFYFNDYILSHWIFIRKKSFRKVTR